MMKYLCILLVLLQGADARQQYTDDYKSIADRYKNAPNISYTISFKSFDTRADKPDTTLTGTYMCKGKKLYSKIGYTEGYVDEKYALSIDNAHKIAFVNYAGILSNSPIPGGRLDSILKKYKCDITLTDLPGDTRRYSIAYPVTNDYKGFIILEFNKTTRLISKVTMYVPPKEDPYDQVKVKSTYKPFVEMVYSNYNFSTIPDAVFSTDKYVTIKGKEVTPKGTFANYQIINSLLYNKENR